MGYTIEDAPRQGATDVVPKSYALSFDVERYRRLLSDVDLSDEERERILRCIWDIIVTFVEAGFSVRIDENKSNNK